MPDYEFWKSKEYREMEYVLEHGETTLTFLNYHAASSAKDRFLAKCQELKENPELRPALAKCVDDLSFTVDGNKLVIESV